MMALLTHSTAELFHDAFQGNEEEILLCFMHRVLDTSAVMSAFIIRRMAAAETSWTFSAPSFSFWLRAT